MVWKNTNGKGNHTTGLRVMRGKESRQKSGQMRWHHKVDLKMTKCVKLSWEYYTLTAIWQHYLIGPNIYLINEGAGDMKNTDSEWTCSLAT